MQKGYKPKFSKQIYKVENIEGRYYIIEGLKRKYLRAFIEKVGEVETNENKPDLDNTQEGFLKDLAKRPIDPESIKQKELLEKERAEQPLALTRPKREIRKPKRYTPN
jgi:hypothetical protein